MKNFVSMSIPALILIALAGTMPLFCQGTGINEFGDVDSNGSINIVDALMTAQFAIGIYPEPFNQNTADVNADNNTNIIDALMIAQYSVKIINTFPACRKYEKFQAQLDEAREKWKKLDLTYYEYQYKQLCFCVDADIPFTVQVKNNEIVSVVNRQTGYAEPRDQYSRFKSIEDFFALTQQALDRKSLITDLKFDALYFYPTVIGLDPIKMAVDDEITYRASALSPVRKTRMTSLEPGELQYQSFTLVDATVTGDILSIVLRYGGGCTEHTYILYAQEAFLESDPVQVNLYLYHNNNQDVCDAIIQDSPCFDLTPIREAYIRAYQTTGTVLLNVHDFFTDTPGKVIQVKYTM